MRTKQYKLVGALAIALCSTVGLAGCGGDDDSPDGGGGGGDAVSEFCASVESLAEKIKSGDAGAAAEVATFATKAAGFTDPDDAAKADECYAKLAEASMP